MFLRSIYRLGFIPSLLYNVVLNKFSKFRPWYNRVDDRVIIGALPWVSLKNKLIDEEHVRGVVSMNENFELSLLGKWVIDKQKWEKENVKFLQLPTQDIFESPSQQKLINGVDFILSTPESVYVHCKAGRTRSATLVCCYLMKRNNWTPQQAAEYLAKRRPQLALHKPQWEAMGEYWNVMIKK